VELELAGTLCFFGGRVVGPDGTIRFTRVLIGVPVARAISGGTERGDGVAKAAELLMPFLGANRLEQEPPFVISVSLA
jgi:hypothetical protein